MVEDNAFIHKIDDFTFFLHFNHERHLSCITGSRVTAILLNAWIFNICEALAVEGLQSTGLLRLVFIVAQEITKVQGLVTIYEALVV